MNIQFGVFEDTEKSKVDEAKLHGYLTEFFGSLENKKFRRAFIAYPHQCYSEDYAPAQTSDDTLEIYVFSAPSEVSCDIQNLAINFVINAKNITLPLGQTDGLKILSLDKKFSKIEDENGTPLAFASANKLWILFDIFHGFGSSSFTSSESATKEMFEYIVKNFIFPPTEEELKARLYKRIDAVLENYYKQVKEPIERTLKSKKNELLDLARRHAEIYKSYLADCEMLEALNNRKIVKAEEIVRNVEKMPFVKKFSFISGIFTVETYPIKVGPFNFGEFRILLYPEAPLLEHRLFKKGALHPYEYSGDHVYCMGGFRDEYVRAMLSGRFDDALRYARFEITNYSTSTKMHNIEDYLSQIMGKQKFEKLMEQIRQQYFPKADGVIISQINGSKVTFVATVKRGSDESLIPTIEKVEIDYEI